MPLPPLLAAKLAKRGLLKRAFLEKEQEEEVFAENYDEPVQPTPKKTFAEITSLSNINASASQSAESYLSEDEDTNGSQVIHQISACPNIVNRYHTCSDYCSKKWGFKKFRPDQKMLEKKEKLLAKFPIPEGWMEVGDPVSGRYYYWNMQTDEVSWMPPSHPKAKVSLSAERLKELNNPKASKRISKPRKNSQGGSDDSRSDHSEDEAPERKPPSKKKKKNQEELDPMDPASYSDVPRGSWTTGLDQRGAAKTGVDVTASGPLFQQRPYPSPGAVLRLNKNPKDVKK